MLDTWPWQHGEQHLLQTPRRLDRLDHLKSKVLQVKLETLGGPELQREHLKRAALTKQ
jgi:hypothetical protein